MDIRRESNDSQSSSELMGIRIAMPNGAEHPEPFRSIERDALRVALVLVVLQLLVAAMQRINPVSESVVSTVSAALMLPIAAIGSSLVSRRRASHYASLAQYERQCGNDKVAEHYTSMQLKAERVDLAYLVTISHSVLNWIRWLIQRL